MSFVSGIMMGASIGTTIHDIVTAKNKGAKAPAGYGRAQAPRGAQPQPQPVEIKSAPVPEFALVSSLSGRRRYRMAALVDNAPLGQLLEQQLSRLDMVSQVKATPATGSLLVEFYPSQEAEIAMNNLMEKLRQKLVVVEAEGNPAPKHEPTAYAKSWSATGSFLNTQVRKLTGNSFDISALISLFFLIRGVRNCLVLGQRPTGPSMIWWALHLMKGWRG